MIELVGRAAELAALDGFLTSTGERAAACVVAGTAGIGKTALVRHAAEAARDRGWRVSAHRPASADADLAMVGLTDLFAAVDDAQLDDLAPPLRHALEVVLLRRDPGATPADTRTVNTAVTAALARLCDDGPVLVTIDDSAWLDGPSARALAFAARRLVDRPIGWLLALREPMQSLDPLDLERAVGADAFTRVEPGALSTAAIFHVVQTGIGVTLSRPDLFRVHEASGGNPLFAIELARSLDSHLPAVPLDVPVSLRAALDARIATVSARGRAALRIAAAASHPRASTVASLSSPAGLGDAERAGIVRVDGERVVFDHPLLRAAIYNGATPTERREAHAALARVATAPEERGRHLALSSEEPSDEVALALDVAAAVARSRGAPDVAAELAELALARTVDQTSEDGWRRRIVLADFLFDAGAARRAFDLVAAIDIAAVPPALRVVALRLQTIVVFEIEGADAVRERLDAALVWIDELTLRVEALILIARTTGDGRLSAELAGQALALLEAQPAGSVDQGQLAEALLASAGADFALGRGLDRARYERAIALETAVGAPRKAGDSARAALSAVLKYADCFAEGRDALVEEYTSTLRSGDESGLAGALAHLPQVELFLGNWAEARRWAEEHFATAQQTEQVGQVCTALCNLAMVEAFSGELEAATMHADEARRIGVEHGDSWTVERAGGILAFVALSQGDSATAVKLYTPAWDGMRAAGLLEPGYARWPADFVEALVGAGELDRARDVLDDVGARADAVDRASIRATTARGRALLAAAQGDLTAAAVYADEALVQHARADVPFERGRTLLVKGQVHRRAKEKLLARAALESAVGVFDALGAKVWAARARDELSRVNIRPGAPLDLTESERRVAELAASGLTNKQVAEAAFISPKTVEANLARVYRKLGISSRAELGRRMSQT